MKILMEKQKKKMKALPAPPARLPEESDAGKTVVVGVRMDQQSRELLTWALVKVAHPGDRVIALHIVPSAAADASGANALLAVFKEFESVIAVYEGFCNLKQIDLKLKVCRGSSLRKLLVQEAKSLAASALILGVTQNGRHALGPSPTSIAKHCAKKLPGDCAVLAVNNGKVVFQRDAVESNKTPHRASSSSKAVNFDVLFSTRGPVRKRDDPADASNKSNCAVYRPSTIPPRISAVRKELPCAESRDDRALALVPVAKQESPTSLAMVISGEARPGWPLLREAVMNNRKNASRQEKSKMSVVQWAMRLPSRYSSSLAVHPDPKLAKEDPDASYRVDDGENRAIVLARTDSSSPSSASSAEEMKLLEELDRLQEKYSSVCRVFSYQELIRATSRFSPDNLVGKGGSSRVYKGRLPDGKELAVKILKPSEDVLQEFVSEIEIITSLHHKNIVSLLGFCFENGNLILVYDYLSRGSLEDILHGETENKRVLSWPERYKIAVGVAEALNYLHGGGDSQPVIHRDVKTSNILLANDFEPQLCDFGLAQWLSSSSSNITCSDVAGTFGYLAPEYFMYGKVNEKIDVYAYGVVLLELLSGRKPVSTGCPKGQESLVMWAKTILQGGKIKQLLDPNLADKYDNDQMEMMVLAASLCIRRAARYRPHIALILKLLQGDDDDITKWARSEIGCSEELDGWDDEIARPNSNIQSHINLALLNLDDETTSVSSTDHSVNFIDANTSLEEYLQGRWSRSSSFDN